MRSGGEHCQAELAVEVRRGALPSGAGGSRSKKDKKNAALPSCDLRLRSGGEHCHPELAFEDEAEEQAEEKEKEKEKEEKEEGS